MGTDIRWTGAIDIDPPVVATQPERCYLELYSDVRLRLVEQPIDGEPGGFRRVINGIVPALDRFSGYQLEEQIQSIVDTWRDRTYAGRIDAVGPEGGQWRVAVVDGKVVRHEPRVLWPDDPAVVNVPPWRGDIGWFHFRGVPVTVDADADAVLLKVGLKPGGVDGIGPYARVPMSHEQARILGVELVAAGRSKGVKA